MCFFLRTVHVHYVDRVSVSIDGVLKFCVPDMVELLLVAFFRRTLLRERKFGRTASPDCPCMALIYRGS